ncbi:MAG: glycosyltransferase [Ignavibacteriales bacterium]|nr:glycosyltransferase [Ignavibacteriales bacterium]
MKLKSLYLRSSFDNGGTETLLLNLFNYPQSQIQFHYAFLKDGNLIVRLKSDTNKYYKVFRKSKIDFGVLFKLSRIIKSENIKVVHTMMFELFYAVLLKLWHPGLRIFHTIHGYFEENNVWAPKFESILILFTKCTFTVSNAARNILIEKGYPNKKIKVLYNAVSLPSIASLDEMKAFKDKIKYHPNNIIAGMIGDFVWWKDQITIIKAYNILKNEIPDLKIVFIGQENELTEKCKTIVAIEDINKRVFFLGSLENASKYLTVFDLFIMSTTMDTFGIVVIEALMQEIPVIASEIEVMKELSDNGRYFDLFEKQNPEKLAEKIKILCNKEEPTKTKDALQYSLNIYSYEKYINNLKEIYSSV